MRTRTSPSAAAQSAAKSPATPPPTTTSANSESWPVSRGSLMVVFASESITSWLSLAPHLSDPRARRARDGVPGARRRALRSALGARARAVLGRLGAAGWNARRQARRSRRRSSRHLATKVDVREVSHLEQLGHVERSRRAIPSAGSSRPRTSGSCRSASIRAYRPTPRGSASTRCPQTAFDHGAIVLAGRDRLRGKLSYSNIGFALAPESVHARRAPRRLRGRARLRGLVDEPQARARPPRRDRVGRQAPRARACGRPTGRAVPLPRPARSR